ncbi:MAG: DUF5067 domain-containing protein [Lachnospiraceae bacterium]
MTNIHIRRFFSETKRVQCSINGNRYNIISIFLFRYCFFRVFRNGAELENIYDSSYSDETKNYGKNIKPGKIIEMYVIYQLSNKKSDVELEITNAFLMGVDTAKRTIKL